MTPEQFQRLLKVLEEIRDGIRENPFPSWNPGVPATPPVSPTACTVCGIDFMGQTSGYGCPRFDCPNVRSQ